MSIFLKKDRPNAKSTYYGNLLPARIRNGWNSSADNDTRIQTQTTTATATTTTTATTRGINNRSWRKMKARNSEKDKENTFGNRPGEHVTIEKDNQNHMEACAIESHNRSKQSKRSNRTNGGGPIGTEAMIEQHLERNTKIFKYPPQGYWTRIELSILYSMILEPKIFPASAVCEHIQQAQEEFELAAARANNTDADADADASKQQENQPQHFMEPYLYERPPPGQYTAQMTVSYSQFVALLVLAGEEWPAESKVPQTLCQSMVQCIVQYADRHGLDRQVELEEGLRKPLQQYSRKRGAKITLSSMWPVYLGAITTALTGTAVPLGLSYIASFALNEQHVQKESVSEENRMLYQLSMERAANPEHESLIAESNVPIYYQAEEGDEEEEVILWDDDEKKKETQTKKQDTGLFDAANGDDQYSYIAQEVKQQQQHHHQQQQAKSPSSALAGAGSMLLLANKVRAEQDESIKPAEASYVKASLRIETVDSLGDDDSLL